MKDDYVHLIHFSLSQKCVHTAYISMLYVHLGTNESSLRITYMTSYAI